MSSKQLVSLAKAALVPALAWGCSLNPVRLPLMLIGAALDGSVLEDCAPELLGSTPEMADGMFGRRFDTFSHIDSDTQLLVYFVAGEGSLGSRYVVEVLEGKITALYKTQQDCDGLTDAIQCDMVKVKVIGKTATVIEQESGLGKPKLTMHSRREDGLIRIYDVHKWPSFEGSRYCVLSFDEKDVCRYVRMVGVTASTRSKGDLSTDRDT
jgi:hypothetical protein